MLYMLMNVYSIYPRDHCRITRANPNKEVRSPAISFFVIFGCKKWRVPNTNDESMNHLDEFLVSLNPLFSFQLCHDIAEILLKLA